MQIDSVFNDWNDEPVNGNDYVPTTGLSFSKRQASFENFARRQK